MAILPRRGILAPPAFPFIDRSDPINRGLVAWWRMETNDYTGSILLDRSGNRWNGTANATVASTPGRVGMAGSFNGSNQWFVVGNMGAQPTKGSLSFWFKTPASFASFSSFPNVISTKFGLNGGNCGFRIEADTSGDFTLVAGDNGGSFTTFSFSSALAGGVMATNAWYMLTLTWDSSTNAIKGYMNSVSVFSSSNTTWATAFDNFVIGAGWQSGGGRCWLGPIDEVRVHSRMLQTGDISRLYSDRTGGMGLVKPRGRFAQAPSLMTWLPRAIRWGR